MGFVLKLDSLGFDAKTIASPEFFEYSFWYKYVFMTIVMFKMRMQYCVMFRF